MNVCLAEDVLSWQRHLWLNAAVRKWQSICLIGGIALFVAIALWPRDEPRSAGRKISDWIGELEHRHTGHLSLALRTSDGVQFGSKFRTEAASDACQAILQIGAPAVPFLVKQLGRVDSTPFRNRVFYRKLWERLPKRLRSHVPEPRSLPVSSQAIVQILGLLGPAAAEAVPILTKMTEETNRFLIHYTIDALGEIGPSATSAVPVLAACLHSRDATIRVETARALARIGVGSEAVFQGLEEVASHGTYSVAATASVALWRLQPTSERLIAVSNHIKVGEPTIRRAIVALAGQVAPPQSGIEPILLERAGDESEFQDIRLEAARALKNVYSYFGRNRSDK